MKYKIRLLISGIVLILAITSFYGVFYAIKLFNAQFVPLVQGAAWLGVAAILLITFFFGRFYCSILCPFGILQEFISFVFNRKNNYTKNYPVKYFIASLCFGSLLGGSSAIVKIFEPYTLFSKIVSFSAVGIFILFVTLVLVYYKNRFFCTNICPVGAILGIVSKFGINKIYIENPCKSCGLCEAKCPSGCINSKEKSLDNETCVRCLKCLNTCPNNCIKFGTVKEKQPFNPKRRDFIVSIFALALFGAALNDKKILDENSQTAKILKSRCKKCGMCPLKCPYGAISFKKGEFPIIDKSKCTGCGACKSACHFGAIKI